MTEWQKMTEEQKKTEWQNEQKGQKDKKKQKDKRDRRTKRQKDKKTEGQKQKDRKRFIMYTWFYYNWELIVISRFILIMQQVVARLTLIVMLAMKSWNLWF